MLILRSTCALLLPISVYIHLPCCVLVTYAVPNATGSTTLVTVVAIVTMVVMLVVVVEKQPMSEEHGDRNGGKLEQVSA